MSDLGSMVAVALTFALLVTAHAAILVSLALRSPRWRAALAFIVPPLAPYWGFEEKMRVRSSLWIAGLVLYVAARTVGAR